VRRELLRPRELVTTIAEEYEAAASSKGLALILDVEPELPMIQCDAARVRQVIGNLVCNAIKYTKEGSVIIRTRRWPPQRDLEAASWMLIDVIDTGIGLPADKQDIIFEEFTRLELDKQPGAGLGLAISKHIAEALGGRISVESALGRGSTFTLWIPIQPREAAPPWNPHADAATKM
jgi:signal transduction histidine kinase